MALGLAWPKYFGEVVTAILPPQNLYSNPDACECHESYHHAAMYPSAAIISYLCPVYIYTTSSCSLPTYYLPKYARVCFIQAHMQHYLDVVIPVLAR